MEHRARGADGGIILLVEDNPDDELLTLRALKKSGIGGEVVVVRDGVEALDYLFGTGPYAWRDTEVMPRLVLLDLKLPRMDGLEVLKRLRSDERTRDLPVVVLTSGEGEYEMISGSGSNADGCIRKTVDFTEFSRAIRYLERLPRGPGGITPPRDGSMPQDHYQGGRDVSGSSREAALCIKKVATGLGAAVEISRAREPTLLRQGRRPARPSRSVSSAAPA